MTAHFLKSMRPRQIRAPRGFTLTELLVVIAIIVLLITLLLVALGSVQAKARETQTSTTIQAFLNACNVFRQEHGFYPGVVPEEILAHDPQITSTENMLLHLMGGFIREEDDADVYSEALGEPGWEAIDFDTPSGGEYRIVVNIRRMGDGPIINGRQYQPYFTPGSRELAITDGQVGDVPNEGQLPDLIDAWGQPILCLRQQRDVGVLVYDPTEPNVPAQFDPRPFHPYLESSELGQLGRDQTALSIISPDGDPSGDNQYDNDWDPLANLARFLEHPSLEGQARGAIACFSAGKDGVFFSAIDGAGEPQEPVWNINHEDWVDDPNLIEEYDDIVRFGGS